MVIRAPLEQYPPSIYQVSLLAEAGLRVGVVDLRHKDYTRMHFSGPSTVKRFHGGQHIQAFKESPGCEAVRFFRSLQFRVAVRECLMQLRPKIVIAYEPYAMHAVGRVWKTRRQPKLIWHFHEAFQRFPEQEGVLTRAALNFAARHASRPDLIIFPDQYRATDFMSKYDVRRPPAIVYNCPRRLLHLPKGILKDKLRSLGIVGNGPVIYFHGWIAPQRYLEQLLQAMGSCPLRPALALVGPVSEHYRQQLQARARENGMLSRLAFLGMVSLNDLDSYAVDADVGFAVFPTETVDMNLRYLAGASNKRFQYMAVGLPQITNNGCGVKELMEPRKFGVLVRSGAVEQLKNALTHLLGNHSTRLEVGQQARAAHLDQYNYEVQFQPVREQCLQWCG